MFLLSERIQDIYILTACAGAYAGNIEKLLLWRYSTKAATADPTAMPQA